jgi:histidine decarboxylase
MTFHARDPQPTLTALADQVRARQWYNLAFPGATDLTHGLLADLMTTVLLNNIGSPYDHDGHGHNHTKAQEREVVDALGDLFGAPASRWGYVTGGSSECIEHAMLDARQQLPDLLVYQSAAAHYSVEKTCLKLGLPRVVIAAHDDGQMDLGDLKEELRRRRHRPVMVVATAGTTITEACDDVGAIAQLCNRYASGRYRLHVDAALAGPPLALLPSDSRPGFDFTAGATSIGVSGHKSLGTLMPCGVLIYAQPPYAAARARIAYTGTTDVTLTGSRSGHTPLLLWTVLAQLGEEGLRTRFEAARELAAYTHQRLRDLGIAAQRNPHAFTVFFPPPPPHIRQRWVISGDDRYARIICMPGVCHEQIDEFCADLAAVPSLPDPAPPPRQRPLAAVGPPRRKP